MEHVCASKLSKGMKLGPPPPALALDGLKTGERARAKISKSSLKSCTQFSRGEKSNEREKGNDLGRVTEETPKKKELTFRNF